MIPLSGKSATAVGNRYLGCTITDAHKVPAGPPRYTDLVFEYIGTGQSVSVTAYSGGDRESIGSYEVNPANDPTFAIDGSQQPDRHIGDSLLLEYWDTSNEAN